LFYFKRETAYVSPRIFWLFNSYFPALASFYVENIVPLIDI